MLNKVILVGRIVKEVELRQTQSGVAYTYLTLAVNRPGNNDQTDFIDCVAWRGTAEIIQKYTNKGSLIAIEGRLEVYNTESNGNYEKRVNVNIQSVTLLDSRRQGAENSTTPEPATTPAVEERQVEEKVEAPKENPMDENKEESTEDFNIDFDSIKF